MDTMATVTIPLQQNATQENLVTRDDFIAFEKKFTSASRRVTFFMLMSGVFFLLTTVASGACFYFYTEMQAMSRDIPSIHGDEMDIMSDSLQMRGEYEFSGYEYSSGASSGGFPARERQKRKIESDCNCSKKIKRLRKDLKKETKKIKKLFAKHVKSLQKQQLQAPIPAITARTVTTEATTTTVPHTHMRFTGAAHYNSYVDNDFIRSEFGAIDYGAASSTVKCKEFPNWNGTLCRNRTFTTNGRPATLKMFREADWMKSDSRSRIFNQRPDGSFEAKRSGIYHVYVHVLFYEIQTKVAVGILHSSSDVETVVFRCERSVDVNEIDFRLGANSKFTSCGTNGILYLKAGDRLQVQNLFANAQIDVTANVSYFGAILFSESTSAHAPI